MKALHIVYLFVIAAIFAACSSTDDAVTDKPSGPIGSKTYTMTINANKHGDTRALTLDGKTLNSSWKAGEQVKVIEMSSPFFLGELGTLTAQSDGESTTLKGTITAPTTGDAIQLVFPRFPDKTIYYTGQKGTLEDIAANFDYATCQVARDQLELADGNITTKSPVLFTNQQAIVKFNLQNSDGTPISALSLTIHDENNCILQEASDMGATSGDLTINLDEHPSSEVWVAISSYYFDEYFTPKTSDLTLTATDGSYNYTFTKSNVTFESGNYYSITVKMNRVVDVSTFDFNEGLMNGDILTGTDDDPNHCIYLPWGYPYTEITFMDFKFKGEIWNDPTCETRINIKGQNELNNLSNLGNPSQIEIPSLILKGDGTLQLSGGLNVHRSVLTIESGTINIEGSGINIFCGELYITGGIVTSTPIYDFTCGIGIGYRGYIEISGGSVTATGTISHAGIGTVQHNNGSFIYDPESENGTDLQPIVGEINISGGTVHATGGINGAGIGSSAWAEGVNDMISLNINITGGEVVATGGTNACGIGRGYQSQCSQIIISGEGTSVTSTKGVGSTDNIGADYVLIGNNSGSVTKSPYTYPE